MPELSQFFSVVVQISAGILAIIIALSTVIHSIGVEARTTKRRQDTIIDYNSPLGDRKNTISICVLTVVGVLIPIMFLISTPKPIWTFSLWELAVVQFGVVIVAGVAAAYLFHRLWTN